MSRSHAWRGLLAVRVVVRIVLSPLCPCPWGGSGIALLSDRLVAPGPGAGRDQQQQAAQQLRELIADGLRSGEARLLTGDVVHELRDQATSAEA